MMFRLSTFSLALAALAVDTIAQFPPEPEGVTLQHLQSHPDVSVSYKETFICETQARGWAGYVNMPSSYLSQIQTDELYNISMFFWYFEARANASSAPTAIYLAGGPGEPGVSGAVSDGGPCTVLADSNTTVNNPWSWNNHVNMLYIDQPVSTGFSYSQKVNSTLDLLFLGLPITSTGITPFEDYDGSPPPANATFLHGTFSEQNPQKTANTTLTAAKTLWHFCQAWLVGFPEYKTVNRDINIFGNSYGGYYVPVAAQYFLQQNEKIAAGETRGIKINVNTIGWTNGCTDQLIQGEYYPRQAYNNTYGLQVIPKNIYEESTHNFTKSGGCRDLILECRRLGDLYDPDYLAINSTVNKMCVEAEEYCATYVLGAYDVLSNRSDFDMAHLKPDPFPTSYWLVRYLNKHWVQKELGVPVNFSTYSLLDNNVFLYKTGDPVRTAGLKSMEYLLDHGVKIAMMYGDRDYRCPWIGAEHLSLAARWYGDEKFRAAGYEYVQTNSSYRGGIVRQYGILSFTRIFEAGHDAQVYQPETVFRLFNRAIFDQDLATGTISTFGPKNNYTTRGPSSGFEIKDKLPVPPPPWNCNLNNVLSTCTQEQYEALQKGTAEIIDFNIMKPSGGSPGSIAQIL